MARRVFRPLRADVSTGGSEWGGWPGDTLDGTAVGPVVHLSRATGGNAKGWCGCSGTYPFPLPRPDEEDQTDADNHQEWTAAHNHQGDPASHQRDDHPARNDPHPTGLKICTLLSYDEPIGG